MSGFICVSIDKAIKQILSHINKAVRCKDELEPLKELVTSMEATMRQIQHYRLLITWKKRESGANERYSESDKWVKRFSEPLNELKELLQKASGETQNCAVSTRQGILRDQMSERIRDLTAKIAQHLQSMSSLVGEARAEGIVADARHITPAWQTVKSSSGVRDILAPSTTSETISRAAIDKLPTGRMKLIDEPIIAGQEKYLERLEKLLTDEELLTTKKIGVLGKGGSGKTLLLKTLFNSEKVRNCFNGGFMLWLTVSQSPSFTSLRNKLWTQIKIQDKQGAVKNINEQHVEIWIAIQNNVDAIQNTEKDEVKKRVNEALQHSNGFVLFLDDVWESDAGNLLNELGIQQEALTNNPNAKVIFSSRDRETLPNMEIVEVKDLNENDSWKLFSHHSFPHDNKNPPGKEEGKLVCQICQGLSLAIKVVGKAMAGSTDRKQWRWALQRLSNAESVYDCRHSAMKVLKCNAAFFL